MNVCHNQQQKKKKTIVYNVFFLIWALICVLYICPNLGLVCMNKVRSYWKFRTDLYVYYTQPLTVNFYYFLALRPNTPELINLSPRSHTTLSVSNITSTTSYGIFQAHSQFKNITLSLYRNITSETSETGHSVGVLIVVKEQTTLNVFIASHHNVTLVVLVVVTFAENGKYYFIDVLHSNVKAVNVLVHCIYKKKYFEYLLLL